ncbi:MAG: hypothetical protein KGH79_02780 [Patescibacteria group bacterium]|nr:hypothetical protein [Patescibacteria group bacterium]
MKKDRVKDLFLEQLRKVPNIQVAVEKVGVARSTVYKWRDEDPEFRESMENALIEGESMLNDLSENQLYSLILERHYPSIQFWLRHRNPRFRDKLEITTQRPEESTTAEEDEAIQRIADRYEPDIISLDEPRHDEQQTPDKLGGVDAEPSAAPGGDQA